MASRKKRMMFASYEEALAKTEELAASGDQESDDFLAAAEAAAQFFLRDHDSYQFNGDYQNETPAYQNLKSRKWLTINDLLSKTDKELARKLGKNFVIVERQEMPSEVSSDELD